MREELCYCIPRVLGCQGGAEVGTGKHTTVCPYLYVCFDAWQRYAYRQTCIFNASKQAFLSV
jgi:hypothetical protein